MRIKNFYVDTDSIRINMFAVDIEVLQVLNFNLHNIDNEIICFYKEINNMDIVIPIKLDKKKIIEAKNLITTGVNTINNTKIKICTDNLKTIELLNFSFFRKKEWIVLEIINVEHNKIRILIEIIFPDMEELMYFYGSIGVYPYENIEIDRDVIKLDIYFKKYG